MQSAKTLEELVVWQLACELRDAIAVAVEAGSATRDFDFKDQILRSSRSTAANIAEGFGYFRPRPFANYLLIARASLMATKNHVLGAGRHHFLASDQRRFRILIFRLQKGIASLVRYLRSCPPDMDFRTHL
jgi:four helix bundle protein